MTDFSAVNTACFSTFGEAATYTPVGGSAVVITAIVDLDVEIATGGIDTAASERRNVVHLLKTEVAAPARGAVVAIGAASYTLERVLEDDGYIARWVAR